MSANKEPIFTLIPNIGTAKIPTTYAQPKNNGASAATGVDFMILAFIAGAEGSYVDKVRFHSVASTAATNSVPTTLRVYLSSVAAPETPSVGTTAANTQLLAEISAPLIASGHSTIATNYIEVVLGIVIPTGKYIHVSQHVAQTTNQQWQATVFGGDY